MTTSAHRRRSYEDGGLSVWVKARRAVTDGAAPPSAMLAAGLRRLELGASPPHHPEVEGSEDGEEAGEADGFPASPSSAHSFFTSAVMRLVTLRSSFL